MNEQTSARWIARILVALILGALALMVYGFAVTAKQCEDRGGAYVSTATGYDCVEKR